MSRSVQNRDYHHHYHSYKARVERVCGYEIKTEDRQLLEAHFTKCDLEAKGFSSEKETELENPVIMIMALIVLSLLLRKFLN